MKKNRKIRIFMTLMSLMFLAMSFFSRALEKETALDTKVKAFFQGNMTVKIHDVLAV